MTRKPTDCLSIGLVIDGADHFFLPVETALCRRYIVNRFAPRFIRLPVVGARVNRWLLERQMRDFLRRHDLVFFEWAASLLIIASRLPRLGTIVTRLHSVELATAADAVEWSAVDRLIVLNQTMLARLRVVAAGPLPPATVIANGVDLQRFQNRARAFQYRLGMACTILPIKRVYEMVLCLYELRRQGLPYTLSIAGDFAESDKRYHWALKSLVSTLDLSDAVQFSGYVEAMPAWLADIDVFVSNSYWEGQQVALLEAMASGCYCLAHCWTGVEDLLPAENIFVTGCDLRGKLLSYAGKSSADKRRAQAEMRGIAERRFDERRMIDEIIALVESVGAG